MLYHLRLSLQVQQVINAADEVLDVITTERVTPVTSSTGLVRWHKYLSLRLKSLGFAWPVDAVNLQSPTCSYYSGFREGNTGAAVPPESKAQAE